MWLWNTNAPGKNKVQIGYFKYKGHGQGHKVIDPGVTWEGSVVEHRCLNMKSLSLTAQKLLPRLSEFATDQQTHTQTGQKLHVPNFHFRGIITRCALKHKCLNQYHSKETFTQIDSSYKSLWQKSMSSSKLVSKSSKHSAVSVKPRRPRVWT